MPYTPKVKYDFNTAADLEVQLNNGEWYRVTPCDFRSFYGPRRINGEPYSGYLYYKQTNDVVSIPQPYINYPEGYTHPTSKKNR
jgi:hypothetical protein